MKDIFLTGTLIFLTLLCSGRLAADDANLEYKIKAGYLYNFTKFITWPKISGETFNLCILGSDPFGPIIDPIEKKSAFGRSIRIFRVNQAEFLSGFNSKTDCHILYLNNTDNRKTVLEQIRANTKNDESLVVGESDTFAAHGGMIGFVNRNGKIKLEINLQSVKQTGLRISAKLLEIAELIKEESHD